MWQGVGCYHRKEHVNGIKRKIKGFYLNLPRHAINMFFGVGTADLAVARGRALQVSVRAPHGELRAFYEKSTRFHLRIM